MWQWINRCESALWRICSHIMIYLLQYYYNKKFIWEHPDLYFWNYNNFQILGLMPLNIVSFKYSAYLHSPWIWEGWSMHWPTENSENNTMWFPQLGHQSPLSFRLVFWITCCWNDELPCKTSDHPKVTVMVRSWGEITWKGPETRLREVSKSPSHLSHLCSGTRCVSKDNLSTHPFKSTPAIESSQLMFQTV